MAQAVPEMRDNEVVVISEKMQAMDLLKCVYEMYEKIHSPHNFRVALAAGKWLLLLYKHNQAGTDVVTVPDLCTFSMLEKLNCMRSFEVRSMGRKKKQKRSL